MIHFSSLVRKRRRRLSYHLPCDLGSDGMVAHIAVVSCVFWSRRDCPLLQCFALGMGYLDFWGVTAYFPTTIGFVDVACSSFAVEMEPLAVASYYSTSILLGPECFSLRASVTFK